MTFIPLNHKYGTAAVAASSIQPFAPFKEAVRIEMIALEPDAERLDKLQHLGLAIHSKTLATNIFVLMFEIGPRIPQSVAPRL